MCDLDTKEIHIHDGPNNNLGVFLGSLGRLRRVNPTLLYTVLLQYDM